MLKNILKEKEKELLNLNLSYFQRRTLEESYRQLLREVKKLDKKGKR